jgi:uncharacterized protein DUF4231
LASHGSLLGRSVAEIPTKVFCLSHDCPDRWCADSRARNSTDQRPSPNKYKGLIQLAAIVTGLFIAIAAGIEEIFHYGDIWREKRNAAELLKIEGWRYLQLARPYRQATHKAAYSDFAANVELLIEREIKDYMVVTQPAEKGEIQKLIGEEIAEYMKQNRPNKQSHQHH